MCDFSKLNYSCENQMTFEECLKEIEEYKWQTGQYMPLPIMEDLEDGKNNKHR